MCYKDNMGNVEAEKNRQVRRLTRELDEAIIRSRSFSWRGLFRTEDQLRIPHLVLILERAEPTRTRVNGRQDETVIVAPFVRLSLRCRPRVCVDLYYSRPVPTADRVTECLSDLRVRFGSEARLLAEQPISVA